MGDVEEAERGRALELPINRDLFLRRLFRHLTGALEDVVGSREVSGLLGVVGQALGDEIDRAYRMTLQTSQLTREQVAMVIVDFKRRIGSDFHVVEQDDERIVLGCRACAFGDDVLGRPATCVLASNICGAIAAQNLGYARVVIQETIAAGAGRCRLVIHLRMRAGGPPEEGREFFRGA
jgi:hypothetical protein